MLSRRNEVSKALVLLTGHCAIATALKRKVLFEVGIQVLFKGEVPDKAHSTNAAVELDAIKVLSPRSFTKSA